MTASGTYPAAPALLMAAAQRVEILQPMPMPVALGQVDRTSLPDAKIALTPTYADAFSSELGGIHFLRNPKGAVTEMSVSQDRVWDLRFTKGPASRRP